MISESWYFVVQWEFYCVLGLGAWRGFRINKVTYCLKEGHAWS
jgi:hypothetical protein